MATTPRGYPYPIGTDRVMDGDDAIHALASAVDDKVGGPMSAGTFAMPVVVSGAAAVTVAVTLPAGRFAVAPLIMLTSGHYRVTLSPGSPTTTGFSVAMANYSGTNSSVQTGYWLALATV